MPRVSVLTATYNQERYVEHCLESVRDQTFRDLEHVVVDDGSSDGTPAILEGRSDIVYFRQENLGNVVSRNRALELSRGEFLAVLDGDDWWDPRKLERQVALMDADPGLGLVYTGMVEVDEDGARSSAVMFTDIASDPIATQLISNATPFSSMLIRRRALDSGPLLDPRFNMSGDKHLTLRIALGGWRFAGVPEPMLYLRTHPASMRRSPEFRREYLRQLLGILEDVAADSRLPARYSATIRRAEAQAYFTTAWLMIDRGSAEERRAARAYLAEAVRQDPALAPKVGRQLVKSLVRGLGG
jgi:glycosyltransferase involved in cell wall biosynthesis